MAQHCNNYNIICMYKKVGTKRKLLKDSEARNAEVMETIVSSKQCILKLMT